MQSLTISKQNQGWVSVGILVISAAIAPILIRFAQDEGIPSLTIIIWRLIIATLIITPLAWQRHGAVIRRMSQKDWGWASLAGFFHAVGLLCLFFSLEYTTVFINSVLRRTSPIWTIILEIVLLNAVFTRRVWLGVFITLFGSLIIILGGAELASGGSRPLLGAGLSLLNALTLGIYIVIGRKVRNNLPFLAYSWVLFGSAALIVVLFGLISGTPFGGFGWIGLGWIVLIAIVAQVIGHLSANYAVRLFPATFVSISLQLSVVISSIIAFFYFAELPNAWQITGSVIIIGGVIMLRGQQQ